MQLSCLHLGFYQAGWGMFRGTSLRTRSLKQFQSVVELISQTPLGVWEIDAHCYTAHSCAVLAATASQIRSELRFPENEWPTATLATKIMLGVFGNVPSFDKFVVDGLRAIGLVGLFGTRALPGIGHFYQQHSHVIGRNRVRTLDFVTGQTTERLYTCAKVIDEIFFIQGGGSP